MKNEVFLRNKTKTKNKKNQPTTREYIVLRVGIYFSFVAFRFLAVAALSAPLNKTNSESRKFEM